MGTDLILDGVFFILVLLFDHSYLHLSPSLAETDTLLFLLIFTLLQILTDNGEGRRTKKKKRNNCITCCLEGEEKIIEKEGDVDQEEDEG